MTRLQFRFAALVLFALFCATVTYWIITLGATRNLPSTAPAAMRAPISVDAAENLFGGQKTAPVRGIELIGVLALQHGAAAIISVGGEPARTITLGNAINDNARLTGVRERSIVVDQHGTSNEIFLPPNPAGPTIYVR